MGSMSCVAADDQRRIGAYGALRRRNRAAVVAGTNASSNCATVT